MNEDKYLRQNPQIRGLGQCRVPTASIHPCRDTALPCPLQKTTLNNHPVWQNLSEVVNGLDANALAWEHLELCDYTVSGYWDECDRFYQGLRKYRIYTLYLGNRGQCPPYI